MRARLLRVLGGPILSVLDRFACEVEDRVERDSGGSAAELRLWPEVELGLVASAQATDMSLLKTQVTSLTASSMSSSSCGRA